MANENQGFKVSRSIATCDCGFRGLYLDQSDVTGLSNLKRKILIDKVKKEAKRDGITIMNSLPENCPGCGEKFEYEHRTE